MNFDTEKVSQSVGGGRFLGWFGLLLAAGVFGLGPCTDCFYDDGDQTAYELLREKTKHEMRMDERSEAKGSDHETR